MKSPQQVTANWASKMAGAAPAYTAGIDSVQEAPNQKAAAAAQSYAQGTANAVQSGRYQAGNQAVTLESWKNSAKTKGAQRLATGAQASQAKFNQAMSSLLPYIENAKNSLPPRGPKGTNQQRMIGMHDAMLRYKKS